MVFHDPTEKIHQFVFINNITFTAFCFFVFFFDKSLQKYIYVINTKYRAESKRTCLKNGTTMLQTITVPRITKEVLNGNKIVPIFILFFFFFCF